MEDDLSAEVTARLFGEFALVQSLPVIATVVRRCRVDLQGSPPGAMAELVERAARQRLLDLQPVT